jgi:hypothetical protein
MAEQFKFTVRKDTLDVAQAEFVHYFGSFMMQWSALERGLYHWFEQATGMNDSMARAIFYGARGFGARAEMLEASLDHTTSLTDQQRRFLKEALVRSRNYSAFRNQIAHGEPRLALGTNGEARFNVAQGKHVPTGAALLTVEDINRAGANVHTLQRCIHEMVSWLRQRNPNLRSPEECLALVSALPSQANGKSDRNPGAPQQPSPQAPVNKKAYRAERAARKAGSRPEEK